MSEASNDTRIGIQAKFPVKKRELNGLNRVAAFMNDNRVERVPVVGYVEFVKHTDTIDGDELTVSLVAVEPVIEPDGSDPHGHGATVRRMIEAARKGAGKAPIADTLFTGAQTKELDAELDGQIEGIDRGAAAGGKVEWDIDANRPMAETRAMRERGEINASGELVAEASGEEIMAERAEAAKEALVAATAKVTAEDGKRKEAAAARPDLKAAVTGKPAEVATVDETRGQDASAIVTPGYVARNNAANGEPKPTRTARPARQRPATADPFTPAGGDAA